MTPTRVRAYEAHGVTFELGAFGDGWRWRAPGGEWSARAYDSSGGAKMAIAATKRLRDGLAPCEYCSRPTHGRAADNTGLCPAGTGCGIGLPTTPPATNAGAGT
jgi:hypothetical protein